MMCQVTRCLGLVKDLFGLLNRLQTLNPEAAVRERGRRTERAVAAEAAHRLTPHAPRLLPRAGWLQARDESLLRTLDSKASTLAASLTARRHYFKVLRPSRSA